MNIYKEIELDKSIQVAMVDTIGNALIKYNDGKVMLKLQSEKRKRNIGIIKDQYLYVNRKSDKHLHRKSNSYGFNYLLLKKSKIKFVMLIEDEITTYKIPVSTILDYGKVMYFKNSLDGNSFELQIFLNKNLIKQYANSGNN